MHFIFIYKHLTMFPLDHENRAPQGKLTLLHNLCTAMLPGRCW